MSGAAAAILLCLGLTIWFSTADRQANTVVWSEAAAPMGKQVRLVLPDSSTILLAAGSAVSYPSRFSDTLREVRFVRGEVFFDIHQDRQRPFVVHTSETGKIRVLGTQFNVKQSPSSEDMYIALVHGQVVFEAFGHQYMMRPGDLLAISGSNITRQNGVDLEKVTAWKENILWFDQTPIMEVLFRLEQYYGVTFVGKEHVSPQTLNGRFESQPLHEVLQILEQSTGLRFEKKGQQISIQDRIEDMEQTKPK